MRDDELFENEKWFIEEQLMLLKQNAKYRDIKAMKKNLKNIYDALEVIKIYCIKGKLGEN